jgi:hypothetical protein
VPNVRHRPGLKEAQDEAAQLVADAADQATLVADAANLTTESLLASTQVEADEIRGAAMAEDLRLGGLATTELEGHGRRTRYCCPRRRRRSNPGSYGPAPSCGNWTRRPPSA